MGRAPVGRRADEGAVVKVLVTGGTSLLGRVTARRLLERGDDVTCLQRGRADVDCRQVQVDVRDATEVTRAVAGHDAVIHAAARVGVVGSWEDFRTVNIEGTANVVRAAAAAGVNRIVHVSSPSVSHSGSSLVGATADAPVIGRRGAAHYPESKARAEVLVLRAGTGDLHVVVIRPHLVWGPGDEQLVGRIVARAHAGRLALVNGGRALIDTIYIDNAAEALVAALDAPAAACAGRAYVVANGEPRPIRELVAGICGAAGAPFAPRSIPLRTATIIGGIAESVWRRFRPDDEPPITRFLAEQLGTAHWFDPRPARDDLKWTPRVTIDEGLARLGAAYDRPPVPPS